MILGTKASSVKMKKGIVLMFLQKRACKSTRSFEGSDFCEDGSKRIQQNQYFDPVDDIMETKINTLLFTPMIDLSHTIIFDD